MRQAFKPLKKKKETQLPALVNALYGSAPSASIFDYVSLADKPSYAPEDDVNVMEEVDVASSACVPPTLPTMVQKGLDPTTLTFSEAEQKAIEEATQGQHTTAVWREQCVGRVTGSLAHNVMTKVRTLTSVNNRSKETKSITKRIMGETNINEEIPSLKYGRLMEKEAVNVYTSKMKTAGHANVKVMQSGLWVLKDKIYVAASPDGLVSCDCCGSGLVEIKCPLSAAHEDPNDVEFSFLKKTDGKITVNPNHTYYTQMVTQMGVTQRSWCDLFVYTKLGNTSIRMQFDQERWSEVLNACNFFYINFISPALQKGPTSPPSSLETKRLVPNANISSTPSNVSKLPTTATEKISRKGKDKLLPRVGPIYCCGICSLVCKELANLVSEDENSVQCDSCKIWFHWGCCGFYDSGENEWFCSKCGEDVL